MFSFDVHANIFRIAIYFYKSLPCLVGCLANQGKLFKKSVNDGTKTVLQELSVSPIC